MIIFLSSTTYETREENREIWPFFPYNPALILLRGFPRMILLKIFSMDMFENRLIFSCNILVNEYVKTFDGIESVS